MPSGRHAGGRSSMGSSRSRSSFGSSRRSSSVRMGSSMGMGHYSGPSHHHHWHGPRRFRRYGFWGPTVVLTDGQSSAMGVFIMLIFMSLFFGFILFMGGMSVNSEIEQRESEHEYYMAFIDSAKAAGRKAEVHVTGMYEGENNKWWIEYEFGALSKGHFDAFGDYLYDGWSYTMYTLSEATQIRNSGWIEVYHDFTPTKSGVDKNDILEWDRDTDTIPVDYENQTLSMDGDYQDLKETKTVLDVIFYICIDVAVVSLIACVRTSTKAEVEAKATVNSTSSTTTYSTSQTQSTSSTHTYCAYCGSKLDKSATKCPNCGSKTN